MLKFNKGDDKIARPKGTNNNMRTLKEKEKIILEYYEGKIGRNEICRKYGIATSVLRDCRKSMINWA